MEISCYFLLSETIVSFVVRYYFFVIWEIIELLKCQTFALSKGVAKVMLKSDSNFPQNFFYLLQWKPLKNADKCFLFRLKFPFSSQDISIFVLTFWSHRKNVLIRNISLFQNSWRHNLFNKQLQYTYCPISLEVKATR